MVTNISSLIACIFTGYYLRIGVFMSGKILVTDDAAFMRMMITNLLMKHGYETFEAINGQDMLDKYEECHPDLVLMDITMPVMDGVEALKKLKAIHRDAKVVMCSAMGQQPMVIEAVQSGASDFLVKPFDPERLVETVKRVINQ